MKGKRSIALIIALAFCAVASVAQDQIFEADPAQSRVEFTLDDVLHTVHGSFQLKRGMVQFNTATGAASGEIVLDATTGDSGSKARDRKMKRDVLETDKYPEITLTVQHVAGSVAGSGDSSVQLEGSMMLHGQSHPMTLTVPVHSDGTVASADTQFIVPYVNWGLKNPSTLFLRVSDKVQIAVHMIGHLSQCNGSCGSAGR